MRVKRERWGRHYYIVARDERGRIITRVKWTSNKGILTRAKWTSNKDLMRIKREKWGHRYYIVARDERGRIITRVKWTSNKDLLKERYSEVEKKVKTKIKTKRKGKRYILTSSATNKGGDSVVFGITSYIEDIEITENHKAFLKELHDVLEEFCESIGLHLTGPDERTEDIEDWKKWASSELEDMDKEDIRYWVEIDLEKWEIVNSHDEYLTDKWQEVVLDKWKGRL